MSAFRGLTNTDRYRRIAIFWILSGLLIVVFVSDLMTGAVRIPFSYMVSLMGGDITAGEEIWRTILIEFRFPKSVTAVFAGAALSVSGMQMQALFRNPLAGPDVLGISAGSSLGVAIVVLGFGNSLASLGLSQLNSWLQILAASMGAALILVLVMVVASWKSDIMTILILGILFGSAISSVINLLQFFSPQASLKTYVVWSMGNLGSATGSQIKALTWACLAGLFLSGFSIKPLNAVLQGEQYARSLGVNIKSTRVLAFFTTSLLTGTITAFCGPLAFVGIAVPHIVRMLFNTENLKVLIPGCMLTGAVMMLLADLISQVQGAFSVLPVNSVTSLMGIPVVVWVIARKRVFPFKGSQI